MRMCRIFPGAFVNQFGEELAVNEVFSPLGVISSSGFCRDYFIKGFALSFESGNAIANGRKRIAVFDHFSLTADQTVSRNNNGLISLPSPPGSTAIFPPEPIRALTFCAAPER